MLPIKPPVSHTNLVCARVYKSRTSQLVNTHHKVIFVEREYDPVAIPPFTKQPSDVDDNKCEPFVSP